MGWCSGTEIFDDVTGMVIDQDLEDKEKYAIIKRLVISLENGDWDCQSDSEYYDHELVQSVFKELHPDWFVDDETKETKELMLTINDLAKQLHKVTKERNELARMAYRFVKDNGIDYEYEFVNKYESGYYK